MKRNLLYVFAIVFTFSVYNTSAQSQRQQPLELVKYNDNVKAPLSVKELALIQEVYADKSDEYILSKPQRLKDVKNILRNRVSIKEYKNKDLSHFKSLSNVELFNNYNKNLKRDVFFNEDKFNPLKYRFDFYSRDKNTLTYRIDNTSYLVTIKSQYQ